MRIGIGITTTYKRPKHREYWRETAKQYTPEGATVYFAHNAKSVAQGKNECLRELKDCDHIFLFDDDTFPISHGWETFFIEAGHQTNNQHFSYLRSVGQIRQIKEENGIGIFNNSAGCMMYLTKEVLEKVGAFDEKYHPYGFEHVNYSERCHKAGLSIARNVCPINADEYIYSLDLDAWIEFPFVHYSTLSAKDMEQSVRDNYEVFKSDQMEIYLPL